MSEPWIFDWDGKALVPATPYDLERCQRFSIGQRVKADKVVKPRSLPMQGKYWACLAEFVRATECVPTAEHLHNLIKLKTGYMSPAVLPTGEVVWVPDSTNFEAMDDEEFTHFINVADRFCAETFGTPLMNEETSQ